MSLLSSLPALLKAALQIFLLAVPLYYLLKFLRRSRGFPILAGLLAVLLALYGASLLFDLDALHWIVGRGAVWIPFVLVVVFQPELRRIFANIGPSTCRPSWGRRRRGP